MFIDCNTKENGKLYAKIVLSHLICSKNSKKRGSNKCIVLKITKKENLSQYFVLFLPIYWTASQAALFPNNCL